MSATTKPTTHSRFQTGVAALGSIGILTPFLPFTASVSPLRVVVAETSSPEFGFITIALPFFLAIMILLAEARTIISGRFSSTEATIGYVSGVITACGTLGFTMLVLPSKAPSDWVFFSLLPWITLTFGMALIMWFRRRGASSAITALTAMQIAYIANATFCLAVFWSDWKSGAIVTAVTVVAYATHIALVIGAARAEHGFRRAFNS
jgi:hypothetical protein